MHPSTAETPEPFVAGPRTADSDIQPAVRHVGRHLLELELLGELLVKLSEFGDELATGLDEGVLRGDLAVGVDAQLEGGEKRVRDLVGGEGDVVGAVQLVAHHVGQGVVFLVEGEERGVGDLCGALLVC